MMSRRLPSKRIQSQLQSNLNSQHVLLQIVTLTMLPFFFMFANGFTARLPSTIPLTNPNLYHYRNYYKKKIPLDNSSTDSSTDGSTDSSTDSTTARNMKGRDFGDVSTFQPNGSRSNKINGNSSSQSSSNSKSNSSTNSNRNNQNMSPAMTEMKQKVSNTDETVMTSSSNSSSSSSSVSINNSGSMTSSCIPTIKSCLKPLIRSMRPGNIPGVVLFHLIGVHRSLSLLYNQKTYKMSLFIQTAIKPSIMLTLFTLLLIVSTSMMVNDYFDARSGVDLVKIINIGQSPQLNHNDDNVHSSNNNKNDQQYEIIHPNIASLLATSSSTLSTSFSMNHNNHQISSNSSSSSVSVNNDNLLNTKPLASGEVPLQIAKNFLSILYGVLLLTITILPGVSTRLLAIIGSMITFYYTQHIKPKTWLKNISCALLMSLAPLTSGFATLNHPTIVHDVGLAAAASASTSILPSSMSASSLPLSSKNSVGFWMAWKALGPLFCSLFCGFMGREMMMDITDRDADKDAGIYTVPVVYGKRIASKIILLFWLGTGVFASIGPMMEVWSMLCNILKGGFSSSMLQFGSIVNVITDSAVRRLSFALLGGTWLLVRAIQVVKSEGQDEVLMKKAIEEGKLNVLLILASAI
jgi:4-hydroxybenzoate polyprenyltransferase